MRVGIVPLLVCLSVLVYSTVRAATDTTVTLNLDLRDLNGTDLQQIIRSVLAPQPPGDMPAPLDLVTLFRLHREFQKRDSFSNHENLLDRQSTRKSLQAAMRETVNKADSPTLRRLALGDGKMSADIPELRPVLAHRLIEIEVAKICADPKWKPQFGTEIVPLPEGSRSPFPVVIDEGIALQHALSPLAKLLARIPSKWQSLSSEEGLAREKRVRALYFGQGKPNADGLVFFPWDRLLPSPLYFDPTDASRELLFLALLRERRIAEAAGLCIFVPDSPEWIRQPDRSFDEWKIRFLKYCGIDWEEALYFSEQHIPFLAAAGSEKTAQTLLAKLKSDWNQSTLRLVDFYQLSPFLIPGKPDSWADTDPRKAISVETQSAILNSLDAAISDDLDFNNLDALLGILDDLHRAETKATLHRLLHHPSTTYAEKAARILRGFGETIAPIPPASPVRFRVYLNDKPWPGIELSCQTKGAKEAAIDLHSLETDAAGFATISRDDLIAPGVRGPTLRIFKDPSTQGQMLWNSADLNAPWVATEIPMPRDLDETTEIRLTAVPVPIEIEYMSPPSATRGELTHLELIRQDEPPSGWRMFLNYVDSRVPAPEKFALGTIGPGKYRLFLLAPGSARYLSDPIQVAPGMAPLKVKLEKGADISAMLLAPENGRGTNEVRLFRDAQDVTETYSGYLFSRPLYTLFMGVPKGHYQLRVLSSAEFMRFHHIQRWEETDEIDCVGTTADFTIDDSSPSVIDLGHVENKPVDASRAKAEKEIHPFESP